VHLYFKAKKMVSLRLSAVARGFRRPLPALTFFLGVTSFTRDGQYYIY